LSGASLIKLELEPIMLLPDVIDNRTFGLEKAISSLLGQFPRVHVVLGHLFVPGLSEFIANASRVDAVRILIGSHTHSGTIEQLFERHLDVETVGAEIERQLYPKRPELRKIIDRAANALSDAISRMEQSEENLDLLRTLVQLIELKRLHFRIYPRGPLPSKAYLFEARDDAEMDKALAILGSTNLAHSRVSHPSEMNVVIRGSRNYREIRAWFDELWGQSEDFGAHILEIVRFSWASDVIRPYDVYMKSLYSLLKDRLEEDSSKEILWDDEIVEALADYQKLAVRQAIQIIRDHGGVFVADVVGLGKSFIGAAILKQFERNERSRSLIICPATLVTMWERYNEQYQLNARVVSMGLLRETNMATNVLLDEELFKLRDFVLVDESHNFRNSDIQRYRILQQFLAAGKRCCFLTATPRNKSCWDVFNQIKLFHQEDRTDLPIDPPNLREYFLLVERGERNLQDVLSKIMICRTRAHIVKWYGFDAETDEPIDPKQYADYRSGQRRCYVKVAGRKQVFPRRELSTIEYNIEHTYHGIYQDLRAAIGAPTRRSIRDEPLQGLTFARYAAGRYLRLESQNEPRYGRLRNATAALHGLVRVLLFKRFESSVEAFRETVRRMIGSHKIYQQLVIDGILPTEADMELALADIGQDAEDPDTTDSQVATLGGYDLADFHHDHLLRDLEHDLSVLNRILAMVTPITPDQDDKLSVLKRRIEDSPLVGRKILIFTQYTDTARYLFGNLNPSGLNRQIEVVHSGLKDYAQVVGRFAPRANPSIRLREGLPEIRILIATDVLSEGMNLQDCDTIINYDLHWNPVRLIQRFGRIDRIGTDFEVIRGFNFLPEAGLDRNLGLRQILRRRIQEIHDTIGEDSAILDSAERLNEAAMYAIYEPGEATEAILEEVESEGFDLNEAEEMLRLLRRENPQEFDRIAGLADGIRSGKAQAVTGTYVLCRSGGYHKAYVLNEAGKTVTNDLPPILGWVQSGPDLEPVSLDPMHGRNVNTVKRSFDEECQNRAVDREQARSLGIGQRYVLQELRRTLAAEPDEETRARILRFGEVFRNEITNAVRRTLNLIRRNGITGKPLLDELARIYQDHRLRDRGDREIRENDGFARVVCSMTLK
jgi:superfamily II DNA or RNA helicase